MSSVGQMSAILVLLILGLGSADAHTAGTSFLALRVQQDSSIHADWDFDLRDLHQRLDLDADRDGVVTWSEVVNARALIEALLGNEYALLSAGHFT